LSAPGFGIAEGCRLMGIARSVGSGQDFVVLPRRWIVERTVAWLGRCRRMAKDRECLNHKALAFLRLASIRLMLRKHAIPHAVPGQTLSVHNHRSAGMTPMYV
jgi:Transposase DDE domain